MRKRILIGLLAISVTGVSAQDTSYAKKSYGLAALNFINNYVYNGRKDSVNTPYLTASLAYYHKSGFFASVSASYLLRSDAGRIDLFSLGGGYDFSFGNFDGQVAAEKYFYNTSSTNVVAEVKGILSATASYDFGFIRTWLQPGINFNTKKDYWFSCGLDHTVYPDENWEISPSFTLNAETRNYYSSYFGNRRFGQRERPGAPLVTASIKDVSKLKIMDYEFSLPVSYTINRLSFGFTPVYAIPVNPAIITVVIKPAMGPTMTKKFTETTENSFYFSVDIAFRL